MLYLLKSAINNEFLQENLYILAAPRGTEVTVGYAARWVDPNLWGRVRRGERALLVFGDEPYRTYVPARQAEVLHAVDEAGELTLTLVLGPLVAGVDTTHFGIYFAGLSRRQFFVVRDAESSFSFTLDDGIENWKRVVRAIAGSDAGPSRYRESVFLRHLPATDEKGRELRTGHPLEARQVYQQRLYAYAPGLTREVVQDYQLIVEPLPYTAGPRHSLSLPADGELIVPIHAVEAGPLRLDLWVKPNRAVSTTLRLDYQVVESPVRFQAAPAVDALVTGFGARELRELFRVVEMDKGLVRDEALISLIDHILQPQTRDLHSLREQRGLCLARLERWGEAYAEFSDLDPDLLSPQAVASWFVSACRGGMDADVGVILGHFDAWEDVQLVGQLLEVLPLLQEGRRLEIVKDAWVGAGRYAEMWEQVKDTFTRPDSILEVVDLMVDPNLYNLLTAAQAYRYLHDRMEAIGQAPLNLLRRTVEFGLQAPDECSALDDSFLTLVERLLHREGDVEQVWSLVEEGRKCLSNRAWAAATEELADALTERGEEEWQATACELYVDLARVHRDCFHDLEAAEAYLTQAHHMVGEDADLAEKVGGEEARWAAAVARLESVRLWREGLTEVKLQRLRAALRGKKAVFVGGIKRGFDVESVRTELGLADAEFVPHYWSERGSLERVSERIRQGQVDYVIDFAALGGHRNLEDPCAKAGVHYVRVLRSRSLDQIVAALARTHGIELE